MNDSTRKNPIAGEIQGIYFLSSGKSEYFDFKDITYVASETPPRTSLEAFSADGQLQLVLTGHLWIEETGHYPISEDSRDLEAQFYIRNGGYVGYGPAKGGLTVRRVEADGEHKRIEGEGTFKLSVEDAQGQMAELEVQMKRIDIKTQPL